MKSRVLRGWSLWLFWATNLCVILLAGNGLYLSGITFMEHVTGFVLQNYAYQYFFLVHLVGGLFFIGLLISYVLLHWRSMAGVRRPATKRWGFLLVGVATALVVSGLLLWRPEPLAVKHPLIRSIAYWVHVLTPVFALGLYWLHRVSGRGIRPLRMFAWIGAVVGVCALFVIGHGFDPRGRQIAANAGQERSIFAPSFARTAHGRHIRPELLLDNEYCKDCHPDVHAQWAESAHRFASMNNPVYLASVRETRQVSLQRDGNVLRSRWCAGCHDPVPLFSGAFDDPDFDDIHDPLAHAGITCSSCHSIVAINSVRGNGDYTIEEPLHYPFAFSQNPILKWVNHQLIRAKPEFHKRTFLKPFHRTAEFCSVCHKVHIPKSVNDYKFLRGQNHYDSFLLSGVSGHGARSFYYPKQAKSNCAACHMPPVSSADFGAKPYPEIEGLSVRSHWFLGANTALPFFRGNPTMVELHQQFLQGQLGIDLFGLREGGHIDGRLLAPLRPQVPLLRPGSHYLLEVVIRTLGVGHHFTQGTTDSNEVWVHLRVDLNGKPLVESGGIDEWGRVDPEAHFINVFMLDRHGNRIARRNPQDIFVPLYDHQIPPGAANTIHYLLAVPEAAAGGILEIKAAVCYRKFDWELMNFVVSQMKPGEKPLPGLEPGKPYRNKLPVTVLCSDSVSLAVGDIAAAGVEAPTQWLSSDDSIEKIPTWERWNDYGIGLLLKGKAQLRQAAEAFRQVESLGSYHGPLNLARVYQIEGDLDEATRCLQRALRAPPPEFPWWTASWLSAVINRQQGHLDEAAASLRQIVDQPPPPELSARGFDFRRDYEVLNLLGETLFDQARRIRQAEAQKRKLLLEESRQWFHRTLELDPENITAHYNLSLLYAMLGEAEKAKEHRLLHAEYRVDDNARDIAVAAARKRYPAADRAAEKVVLYRLRPVNGGPTMEIAVEAQQLGADNPEGSFSTFHSTGEFACEFVSDRCVGLNSHDKASAGMVCPAVDEIFSSQ